MIRVVALLGVGGDVKGLLLVLMPVCWLILCCYYCCWFAAQEDRHCVASVLLLLPLVVVCRCMKSLLASPPRACDVKSLYKALSSEEPVERRKASACLSRIGRAVTAVQASEKEREADSNAIKAAVKPLLRFQPEAGGGVADDSEGMRNAKPF